MAAIISKVDMTDTVRSSLVVKIVMGRAFWIRVKAAVCVIRLAALICPLSIDIENTGRGWSNL
jgi:hypothetical protein